MATPNVVPRADSEGGLGTASKYWASAYIDNVFVSKIGRDADNLIDFSVDNNITFRINTNNELTLDSGQLYPVTNDGLGLGAAGYGFSDLFLANGAVIKFDNGNVVLTHSNNHLTISDNDAIGFGNANDLKIYHDGSTTNYIQNQTGSLIIKNTVADNDIIFQADDGSGGVTSYLTLDGSANVITAHTHISYLDHKRAYFGNGFDLEIYHSGSNSIISHMGTGDLFIQNTQDDKDIIFQCDDGSGGNATYIRIDGSATITKFEKGARFNDAIRAEFGSSGDFTIQHDGSDSKIENATGDLRIRNFSDDRDIIFENDNGAGGSTTYFYLDGSSATHDGSATTGLFTNWPDKSKISLGTSHDLQIHHDGSNSYIQQMNNATGDLIIKQSVDDADILFQCDDGSGSVTDYIRLDGSSAKVKFNVDIKLTDNDKAMFGNSDDLKIYHSGSHSNIINATGNLDIINNADDTDIRFFNDDASGGIAEYFRLDGSSKLNVFSQNLRVEDTVQIQAGGGNDLRISHNGTNSLIDNYTGHLIIANNSDNSDIIFQNDDGSGGIETYFFLDGSATSGSPVTVFPDNSILYFGDGLDFSIGHNGSNSVITNTGGNVFIDQQTDNGSVYFRCDDGSGGLTTYFQVDGASEILQIHKSLFALDNVRLRAGAAGDLSMVHDGTDSFIENNTGDLKIIQKEDDADMRFFCDDGTGSVAEYFKLDGANVRTLFKKSLNLEDNVQLQIGNSQDLKIYHNTSHSFIEQQGTGDLHIRNIVDDGNVVFQSDDGSGGTATYFQLYGNHSGNPITQFPDNSQIHFGDGFDFRILHDGSQSILNNQTGNLEIVNNSDDGDIFLKSDAGDGTTTPYIQLDGSEVSTKILTQKVIMSNLPTSDPSNAGQLWNDSGTLKISAG